MKKSKEVASLIVTLTIIFLVFYLYLPQSVSAIETMRETVGENRVDILFVGSSHVFNSINPVQMYSDCGYAAYDLAIGAQAPWQSYYYIKEACKTQSPRLIVLDTYMLGSIQNVEEDYKDYQTVNNLLRCPFSINHLEAVMESKAESKLSLILRFPYTYNNREDWNGFTIKKYYGEKDFFLGYQPLIGITEYENLDITDIKERTPLNPKNERYLVKIIEFCKKNGIQILLTNAPWPEITEETQGYFNSIKAIAEEYEIQFIDGCADYPKMGIDYEVDCYGGGHLNHSGVTKYTSWVESFISDNYIIEDRRNDNNYACYNKAAEWFNDWEKSISN